MRTTSHRKQQRDPTRSRGSTAPVGRRGGGTTQVQAWEAVPRRPSRPHRTNSQANWGAKQVEVRVWDSSSEVRYLVIPRRPEGTEEMSVDELAELVTRDSMIGTGLVTV